MPDEGDRYLLRHQNTFFWGSGFRLLKEEDEELSMNIDGVDLGNGVRHRRRGRRRAAARALFSAQHAEAARQPYIKSSPRDFVVTI